MEKLIRMLNNSNRKFVTILNLKIIILFIFVISIPCIASTQTEADSLEALIPELQDREKIEVFEKLIVLHTISAPEKAIELGKQALELLDNNIDEIMKSNILYKMCFAYMRVGKDSTALKLGNESLELAINIDNRDGEAGALNVIGRAYHKSGDYQKALDYYSKSLKIYEELNDRQKIGVLSKNIGHIYEVKSNYSQALAYYQKSLKIFQEIDDKKSVAMVLIRTGYTYGFLGEYEQALEYGLNSLKINEQIDDKMGIANSLGNIGNVYWRLGEFDKVLECNIRSLKINEEIGYKPSIATARANVGLAYAELGDYDRALQNFSQSLKLYEEVGDKLRITIMLNNIGAIHSKKLNDNKGALEYFNKSLKIAKDSGNKRGIAIAYYNIGEIYLYLGKYPEAIDYETKALAIGMDIKSKRIIKMCYEVLSELYVNMGDFENALDNYKLFKSVNDSIFTEESSNKIAEMQVKYETEKKEQKIIQLENNALIQSLEMDKQRYYRNMALLISAFILFVAILIFIGYRQKSRSNKLLNSLNDKIKQSYEKLSVQAEHLQISKKKLQEANKELESFSYSVSHDLKAPLRAINGFARILMEDYILQLDEEAQRLGTIIQLNSQKMGQLIEDMLTFSRIGRAEMKFSVIDMKGMAKAIYNEITTPESRKKIKFLLEGLPNAEGDSNLIRQVWINLISNAVKFSANRKQTVISVTCQEEENKLIYCIEDNGAGFDMRYMDKLFGVFQRLHSEKEFEGTGVGLALVQRIIHRHDGDVWAEGEVDKGANFYFSLPKKGD